MYNNFAFKNWKSLLILGVMCLIFLSLVIHAFQYMPQEDDINSLDKNIKKENVEEKNLSSEEEIDEEDFVEDDEDISEDEYSEEETQYSYHSPKYSPDRSLDQYTNEEVETKRDLPMLPRAEKPFKEMPSLEPLESISKKTDNSNNELENILKEAEDFKSRQNYHRAIEEFEKAVKLVSDDSDRVMCYDEIALLTAILQQYKKSIYYAQQAYQLQPNIEREIFLTRLYYKMGNVEKAKNRMNQILKRDFSIE